MFAAGSHDGAVRVWTRPPDESDEADPTIPTIMSMFPRRSASPYQLDSNMSSSSISLEDFQSGRSRASPPLPERHSASFEHPSGDREYL